MEAKIMGTDVWYYLTSEEKCSRCRRDFREDECPLRFWKEDDADYMLAYCEDCSPEVLGG